MSESEKQRRLDRQRWLAYTIPGVKQFDQYACWAAALEWWSRATRGGRPQLNQLDIMSKYSRFWEQDETKADYGGMSAQNMLRVLSDPPWKMTATLQAGTTLTYSFLCTKLLDGPAFVVYYDIYVNGAHANVIVAPARLLGQAIQTQFIVMEPSSGNFRIKLPSAFRMRQAILGCPP